MSSRCPSDADIEEFVGGTLAEEARAAIQEHLQACSTCRSVVSVLAGETNPSIWRSPAVEGHPPLARGTLIARYLVLDLIGRGAMGHVYAAFDPQLDRRVALKLVNPAFSADHKTAGTRMLREAQAMARLIHPNVVAIHDIGETDGRIHIAMELVEGRSVRAWLGEAARPWREILRVFVDAGRGLAAAHRAGLVHRDFKPDNILIADDGRVLVGDFGLASMGVTEGREASADAALHLTQTGVVLGTPAYMAPEQLTTARVDARADIYAFAVAAWEALCGRHPFAASDLATLRKLAASGRPAEPSRTAVPGRVRRTLVAAMAFDPADRPQTLEPLLATLAADPRRKAIRAGLGLAAVVACVALALAGRAALEARARARHAEEHAAGVARLLQDARENELLLRDQTLLPLHDIGPAEAETRAGLERLRAILDGSPADAAVHEAIGRGLFVLDWWAEARVELETAATLGADSPDLHWILGSTLLHHRDQALDDVRRMAGPSFVEQRQAALDAELLPGARAHLERAAGTRLATPELIAALAAYARNDLDGALAAAQLAADRSPVDHEARALVGQLQLTQGFAAVDRGDPSAEALLDAAAATLEEAARVRRTDPAIFDALASLWVRRLYLQRRAPLATRVPLHQAALLAAAREIAAAPGRAAGHVRMAQAHLLAALADSPTPTTMIVTLAGACVEAAHAALAREADNALALDTLGDCLMIQGELLEEAGGDPRPPQEAAGQALARAQAASPGFPWPVNDLGNVHLDLAADDLMVGRRVDAHARAAIAAASTALEMDPAYVEPLLTLTTAHAMLITGDVRFGWLDPEEEVRLAAVEERARRLPTSREDVLRGNRLVTLTARLEYAVANGEDPTSAADALRAGIDALIQVMSPRMDDNEVDLILQEARATLAVVQAETSGAPADRAAIDHCLAVAPRRFECRALEVRAELASRRTPSARDRAAAMTVDFPRSGRGFALLAEAERRLGNLAPARAAAQAALERAPELGAAWATLGRVEAAEGAAGPALAAFDRAVASNPLLARGLAEERAALYLLVAKR